MQVLLYDEADNLLESRMLKSNEVVSSGERLTFQAYLVDVCEPKDESEPASSSDPKPQPSVQHRKPFAVLKPNFKKSSPSSGILFISLNPQEFIFLRTLPRLTYFPFFSFCLSGTREKN